MRIQLFCFSLLLLSSCFNESHYFKKSLSKEERIKIDLNDTLIKAFQGKSNWYKQYWTGNLLVNKQNRLYAFRQIGEWKQTSADYRDLYVITHFDSTGVLLDETQFNIDGTKNNELTNRKDPKTGVIYICRKEYYANGQLKSKEESLIKDNKRFKDGVCEYYTETGQLYKTVHYKMDIVIDK